jgi:alkanesulfonate monooxygenase SsuD/methylene tetrahydromethanopterin reductase-like flavin-dependent oxidoreductase (luciferase family)
MEVGLQFIFQNTHEGNMSDAEMFRKETDIAILAEKVGMDFVQAPEHHFDPGYAMMPDNLQWCCYLGARTERITVGTGAIILPWWTTPTRVAEKIAMTEILLGDRFMLGFGRGLAKKEYEAFGVPMSEARERFDTASEIILDILDTGVAEYDTPYFSQSRVEIHPWQKVDWRARGFNSVAMTPDSGVAAANIGGTMMSFVQLPWDQHHEGVEAWRNRFHEVHPGKDPGAPIFSDFTFCHEDPKVAEEVARKYLSKYYLTVIKHYDFDGSHWGDTKGYTAYQAGADAIAEAGLEAAAEGFVQSQLWGTPEEIIEGWRKRVEQTGELRPAMAVSYAGMPFDLVEGSLKLIGEKVVPELHKITAKQATAA